MNKIYTTERGYFDSGAYFREGRLFLYWSWSVDDSLSSSWIRFRSFFLRWCQHDVFHKLESCLYTTFMTISMGINSFMFNNVQCCGFVRFNVSNWVRCNKYFYNNRYSNNFWDLLFFTWLYIIITYLLYSYILLFIQLICKFYLDSFLIVKEKEVLN